MPSELTKTTLRFVNETYLIWPMTDADQPRDYYITNTGEHIFYPLGKQVTQNPGYVYRVNHGNAHNVRVTSKVRDLVEFYADTTFNHNPFTCKLFGGFLKDNGIEKLEIVESFYVACRESEIGWSDSKERHELYRKNSAHAFAEYAKKIFINGEALFSEREIQFYQGVLVDPYFQNTYVRSLQSVVKYILSTCHALDLPRCFTPDKLAGMNIFLLSAKNKASTEEIKKRFFIKSDIQIILTGASSVSAFDPLIETFKDQGFSERTNLFIQASLDTDVALRLVMLANAVISTKKAHKIAELLDEVAKKNKEIFLETLDRLERAHTLRDPDTHEEQKFFYYDDDENYLLTQGPLPKSIYTVQFEKITEKLLDPSTQYDVYPVDDQVFIVFSDNNSVYNLTEIIMHTNFEHIKLNDNCFTLYEAREQSNKKITIKSLSDINRNKLNEQQKTLSLAEIQAINFYTSDDGHQLINTTLRNPIKLFQGGVDDGKKNITDGIIHAAMLSCAMVKLGSVPAADQNFRAERYIEPYGADYKKPSIHQEVMFEKGFVSTTDAALSKSQKAIETDLFKARSMHLQFPSSKGFWIAPFSQHPDEFEILMSPTQMQVHEFTESVGTNTADVTLSAVSDLASYSEKTLTPYRSDDDLTPLNHSLIAPIFHVFNPLNKDQAQKDAAVQFLKLYALFDQASLYDVKNRALFSDFLVFILNNSEILSKNEFENGVEHYMDLLMSDSHFSNKSLLYCLNTLINLNNIELFKKIFESRIVGRDLIISAIKTSILCHNAAIQSIVMTMLPSLNSYEYRDLFLIAVKAKNEHFITHFFNSPEKINFVFRGYKMSYNDIFLLKTAIGNSALSSNDVLKMLEGVYDEFTIIFVIKSCNNIFVDLTETKLFCEIIAAKTKGLIKLSWTIFNALELSKIDDWLEIDSNFHYLSEQKLSSKLDAAVEFSKIKRLIWNRELFLEKIINMSSRQLTLLLNFLTQEEIDKFWPTSGFGFFKGRLELISVLIEHKKTKKFIERATVLDGDFFDILMSGSGNTILSTATHKVFLNALVLDYFKTNDGKRVLCALSNRGNLYFSHSNQVFNKINDQLLLARLDRNALSIKNQKQPNELWTSAEIYRATTLFCEGNTSPATSVAFERRQVWVHTVLDKDGIELGEVVFPLNINGSVRPHIIYFPGVLDEKNCLAFDAPPLQKIKMLVDEQLQADFPDIDFSRATRIYTLVVARNKYLAMHERNDGGSLRITGPALAETAQFYQALKAIMPNELVTYIPVEQESAYPNVLDAHYSVLAIDSEGRVADIGCESVQKLTAPPSIATYDQRYPSAETFSKYQTCLTTAGLFSHSSAQENNPLKPSPPTTVDVSFSPKKKQC